MLDIEADRYLALPPGMDEAFRRAAGGEPCSPDEVRVLQPLLARGMLIEQAHASPTDGSSRIVPASRDVISSAGEHPGPSMLARVAVAQCIVAWRIRFRGLSAIIRDMESRKLAAGAGGAERHDHEYAGINAAFEALGLVFRRSDRCLVRSLAFIWICLRRGLAPSLVFGVQASPFSAHCWVQQGDVVLNDTIENVRPFTPIMAV
ncbi:lasso peptide biosynthesis B2 protein [Novosphingobium sp. PP1Y]|uniref:lasso peptide biosynthesis B2 protein n=1 Tax=Novosphingobium sp. PP1Y TaxID=702113 RepID=UPI001313E61B|nr:lasso peptide biosynthesis B2 protein [Novosphingobium sp. PP1Y]